MSGKELLEKLKESGTGANKLVVVSDLLRAKPKADAVEVISRLEKIYGVDHFTVFKANAFVNGNYEAPPPPPSNLLTVDLPPVVAQNPGPVVIPMHKPSEPAGGLPQPGIGRRN